MPKLPLPLPPPFPAPPLSRLPAARGACWEEADELVAGVAANQELGVWWRRVALLPAGLPIRLEVAPAGELEGPRVSAEDELGPVPLAAAPSGLVKETEWLWLVLTEMEAAGCWWRWPGPPVCCCVCCCWVVVVVGACWRVEPEVWAPAEVDPERPEAPGVAPCEVVSVGGGGAVGVLPVGGAAAALEGALLEGGAASAEAGVGVVRGTAIPVACAVTSPRGAPSEMDRRWVEAAEAEEERPVCAELAGCTGCMAAGGARATVVVVGVVVVVVVVVCERVCIVCSCFCCFFVTRTDWATVAGKLGTVVVAGALLGRALLPLGGAARSPPAELGAVTADRKLEERAPMRSGSPLAVALAPLGPLGPPTSAECAGPLGAVWLATAEGAAVLEEAALPDG